MISEMLAAMMMIIMIAANAMPTTLVVVIDLPSACATMCAREVLTFILFSHRIKMVLTRSIHNHWCKGAANAKVQH